MKKIGMISTAAVAVALLAPSAANAELSQRLNVKIDGKTSVKAGTKKKPKIVKVSVSTGTLGTSPSGAYDPIAYAKISMPKGIALNYKRFPACKGTDATTCSSKTRIGKGDAKANVTGITEYVPSGDLEQYIGSGANLLIRVMFERPAQIDETLVGKVTTKGGAYAFDFNVPEILQIPLPDAPQQLIDFTTNFDKKSVKKGKKTYGLVELTSCPKGGYVFKGDFRFRSGATATATSTVKCSSAKKGKKKSSKR